jgi:hypothetical protein
LTAAQVLLLIQQNVNGGNGGGGKKGNCHGCGSSDHWLRDCPKRKNQQGGGNRNGNNGRNRNGNGITAINVATMVVVTTLRPPGATSTRLASQIPRL